MNQYINAQLWQRFNSLIFYLNRHLATQAKIVRIIKRKGPQYEYLTYLHPKNVKVLNNVIKKAKVHQAQLRKNGKGNVPVREARIMLMEIITMYDRVDLDLDYRYCYQFYLNKGRLEQDYMAKKWDNAANQGPAMVLMPKGREVGRRPVKYITVADKGKRS